MSDGDVTEADALQRLEAALDRIAQRTQIPVADPAPRIDTLAIGNRMDRLIVQLRDALADDSHAVEA